MVCGRRGLAIGFGLVVCFAAGCGGSDALTIATAWDRAERDRVESLLRGTPVRWLLLAPGDDPSRLADRLAPPDLILGGPSAVYARLAAEGKVEPGWRAARRSRLGLATSADLGDDPKAGLAFDDPRRSPLGLAWAVGIGSGWPASSLQDLGVLPPDRALPDPTAPATIGPGTWAEGYGRLVRLAGSAMTPGRVEGASLAALERWDVDAVPARESDARGPFRFQPVEGWPDWDEGVAVVRGAPHAPAARKVLDAFGVGGRVGPGPADGLLADLLGSVLVDARDELRAARKALDASGGAAGQASAWMGEPPPWPPASVDRLAKGPNGMAMVETLAAQLCPDAGPRAWLVRSWVAPARPVDGALLGEVAAAEGGALSREPRFRAWLRGEWTAWARQRFRRVARLASAGGAS